MKELSQHLQAPVENVVVKEERREEKYLSSMMPQAGQRLFVVNQGSKQTEIAMIAFSKKFTIDDKIKLILALDIVREISDDDYDKTAVGLNGGATKKLIIKRGFAYHLAINKKNAAKKFLKMLSRNS